jgi:hypothetical protein
LKNKSDKLATKLNSKAFTHEDAVLAYEAFYIPALQYSLAITAINQMDLDRIQSSATTAFLAAMGFNRNMPWDVVYAPKLFQGIGMHHLYDLQGCDSTRLLLQEINTTDSPVSNMLRALLETIQLEAGIGSPILEDTRAIDYIEWGWVPQIRDFLNHIDGKITGATPYPKTFRENDRYIMDSELLPTLSYKERMLIHRCRLFLQVELLSDIADAAGVSISDAWLDPNAKKPSYSTKNWPKQGNPGTEAWKIWRKFIERAFLNSNGKLHKPLGNWKHLNLERIN